MVYLAVLGRQKEISLAELEALFLRVRMVSPCLATFETDITPDINKLGGQIKLAEKIEAKPIDLLANLPEGKITIGVSDYSRNASPKTAMLEALKLKKILVRHHRSVRVVEGHGATLATATSLHNGLSGKNPRKLELIKVGNDWYRVIGVQDIDAYTRRDQARPARDAKVGMLPPKLAQILINLCGALPKNARVLDPFCGTGVVLQEAMLMGLTAYGTDISDRMIAYTKRNLDAFAHTDYQVEVGDATSYHWQSPISAVASESYLGAPMSMPPTEIKLKSEKQTCRAIILGFLQNLATQVDKTTPVVLATPAWLRKDGSYSRLEILDEIEKMGYNVNNKTREGLLYHREGQVVARDIIILRKK